MGENLNLAQILVGIAALVAEEDIKVVLTAVKEQKKKVKAEKKKKHTHRKLTEAEKDALAQGNSQAMILKNEEVFDYRLVLDKDIDNAKKWFNAPKPSADNTRVDYAKAYQKWRVWNVKKCRGYKGNAIMEKASGQSASSSSALDDSALDSEEEESDDDDEAGAVAVAALVEALKVK
jgi:hypothetical protein